MTKITGYRHIVKWDEVTLEEALSMHLEIDHGFTTQGSIDTALEMYQTGTFGDWVATSGRTPMEHLHEAEHKELHRQPSWNDNVSWNHQSWYQELHDPGYYLPHHHVGNIVVVDMELDLDDDIIESMPLLPEEQ